MKARDASASKKVQEIDGVVVSFLFNPKKFQEIDMVVVEAEDGLENLFPRPFIVIKCSQH